MIYIAALLGAWISDRFSNRVAVCLGSLLLVVGFTIASYATHINHVIFGYGPITGRDLNNKYLLVKVVFIYSIVQ